LSAAAPSASAGLGDPVTCGEDLAHNLLRATEIAPTLCGACVDYHILFAARRLTGRVSGQETDRPCLGAAVGREIAVRAAAHSEAIDVVIAGSADTGVLATCAHATFTTAPQALSLVRFAVLDLCDTPLELCRDYARRHGLTFTPERVDLAATDRPFSADTIVHHSVLRFVAPDLHVSLLRKLRGWLKPNGRIVFSSTLTPPEEQGAKRSHDRDVDAAIRAMIDDGSMSVSEPRAAFLARLDRGREDRDKRDRRGTARFASVEQLRELFGAAGLSIVSQQIVSGATRVAGSEPFSRRRLLAVLAAEPTA
jgi:hypothetical protein